MINEGLPDDFPWNEGCWELISKQIKDFCLLTSRAAVSYWKTHLLTCEFPHIFQKSKTRRKGHRDTYEGSRAFSFCKEQKTSRLREVLSVSKGGCAAVSMLYRNLEPPIRQTFVRKTADFRTRLYQWRLRSDLHKFGVGRCNQKTWLRNNVLIKD